MATTTAPRARDLAAAHTAAVPPQIPAAATNPMQARAGWAASRALSSSRSRRAKPALTTGSRVASPIPPPSGGSLPQRFQIHPCASLSLHTKNPANVTGNIGPDSRPTPLSPSCRSLTTVASDTASRGDPTGHGQDPPAPERGWQTPADDAKIGPPHPRWSMGNMSVGDQEGVDYNQL